MQPVDAAEYARRAEHDPEPYCLYAKAKLFDLDPDNFTLAQLDELADNLRNLSRKTGHSDMSMLLVLVRLFRCLGRDQALQEIVEKHSAPFWQNDPVGFATVLVELGTWLSGRYWSLALQYRELSDDSLIHRVFSQF
eukprot:TRINITY_DN14431_c0_g1_i1.p2 TRINITY_DN14431_c0_g1~~TRINITY_DN14431_c0_g1_i1.p2  ORF type:complete len:137 (-),score=20.71 TRINITY_DN14431_c0_g1_i1:204-614(-)